MVRIIKRPGFWLLLVAAAGLASAVIYRIARLAIAPVEAPRMPSLVATVTVERGQISAWIVAEGTAHAVRREFLGFEVQGKVQQIGREASGEVLREGSEVRGPNATEPRGQLLAKLDSRELAETIKRVAAELEQANQRIETADTDVRVAEADLTLAASRLARMESLYVGGLLAKSAIEEERLKVGSVLAARDNARAHRALARLAASGIATQLEQASIALERAEIYAPFDGVIAYQNLKLGGYAGPDLVDSSSEDAAMRTIPMLLIDPDSFEVTLELPVHQGTLVVEGQSALVTFAGDLVSEEGDDASGVVSGWVYSVAPAITPTGRSIQVKIRTGLASARLQDGEYVYCRIVVNQSEAALKVPLESLVIRNGQPFLFALSADGMNAERRHVSTGIFGQGMVEIVEGVEAGDRVIVAGHLRLVDGARVECVDEASR